LSDRYIIPSLDRAVEVLALLAKEHEGMTLAELVRRTSIPKSTLFRILITLERHRCVVLGGDDRCYRLGSRLWELGSSFLEQYDLYHAAASHMRWLAEASGETVFLGKLEDGEVVYLRRMESPKSITVVKKLGQRVPAHCTATGVAMLAFLPGEEVSEIIAAHGLEAFNEATITDGQALRQRLQRVRGEGFAVVDGEYNRELLCISAPVFDHTHRPCASLTAAMLSSQGADRRRVQSVAAQVRQAAQNLSRDLGSLGRNVA
jgi:DNA-binding IclR family transcriptional regulator